MRFSLVHQTALDGEAVMPLALAKAHLRVLDDDSDILIAALRDAALDMVEQYTEKALAPREFKWRGRLSETFELGISPVTAISAITYLDENGVSQDLTPNATLRIAMRDRVETLTNVDVPEQAEGDGVAEITFTAGYAAGMVPPSILTAARLMLGHLFMNREAVTNNSNAIEMPFGVRQLCGPFRQVRL